MESTGGNVLWFTGLSGSGKTTTAQEVYARLAAAGRPAELLDGDAVRKAICSGLGFSRDDRMENIRRIAFVANLLSRHGVTVLVSAITPYEEMRDYLRKHVNGYVEIYVQCSLAVCEARDVKGLYAKARRHEIGMFTGVSDVYDEPQRADLVISTEHRSVQANALRIVEWLNRARDGHGDSAVAEAGDEPSACADVAQQYTAAALELAPVAESSVSARPGDAACPPEGDGR
ncbi:adenylyl-sulfate kinase [Paenibacillus piri]|uniref:Adenylyl-sulfate kinase n=1 Tax=Paenibacillus piri TaxID=2547395 RepID=A0A4R5KVM1_9BACL|nr:adenylyl-sulfate kinase [Paenibacillus piri]TDF99806.1 adenylyl-sulfate kinase [Paenibacillus piri]